MNTWTSQTIKSILPALYFALFVPKALAASSNALLGKWLWDSSDCKKPDFIFEKNQIIHHGSADEADNSVTFKRVKYEVGAGQVTVDFGEPHGFGKSADKTHMTFKVIDDSHLKMVRKAKSMNELVRCP